MIPFKINGKKKINLPTSWEDLTIKQVESIIDETDPLIILNKITGLPEKYLSDIFPYLEFILTTINLDDVQPSNYIYLNKEIHNVPDIKEKTIGQKILFQTVLSKQLKATDIVLISKDLFAIYFYEVITGKEFDVKKYNEITPMIEDVSFITFFSVVKNLIQQFEKIIEEEKKLNIKPTGKQIQAGIKMFAQLGEMNTIDILASGDPTKYKEVEKLEYNVAYWKLYKNKLITIFEANYREIKE